MPSLDARRACELAPTPVAGMVGTWWIVHARPLYERRMARDLQAAGVDCFVPSEAVKVKRQDRPGEWRVQDRLLFPCYLFVNGGDDARYEAARSPHRLRVIDVHRALQPKLARQLADLDRTLSAGVPASAFRDLVVGRRVRVALGPLRGVEGTLVIRQDRRQVFALQVAMMGSAVRVEVDPATLEPAD